jgi:hypothetical protein
MATIFRYAYLLAPVFYMVFFGRYGWSDTDDGFIMGYAWRIFNGEVPYKDFIYVRPPLSLYLHSMEFHLFPADFVYIGARSIAVLQVFFYSMISSFLLNEINDKISYVSYNWKVWGSVGFLLSISFITPMPWHTIDGLFFSTIALFFISKKGHLTVFVAGLLIFGACMTKQSFYPLLVAFPVGLALMNRRNEAITFVSAVVVSLVSFVFYLKYIGAYAYFIEQTSGSTSLVDALKAGIYSYLKSSIIVAFVSIPFWYFLKWLLNKIEIKNSISFPVILIFCALLAAVGKNWLNEPWIILKHIEISHIMFICAGIFALLEYRRGKEFSAILLGLSLAIAWCSSISWGAPSPAFFSTPLIFGFLYLFGTYSKFEVVQLAKFIYNPKLSNLNIKNSTNFQYSKPVLKEVSANGLVSTSGISKSNLRPEGVLLFLFVGIGIIAASHPYRDNYIGDLSCNLGNIEKKYTYIFTTENNCRKVFEAKELADKWKYHVYMFLPAYTISYFINGIQNPLPIDWPMQAEMGRNEFLYQDKLISNVDVVFMDLNEADEFGKSIKSKFYVPSISYVKKHWNLLEKHDFYAIYSNPNKENSPTQVHE